MRDPDRIEPFLMEFAKVWKRNPDMRFGQLVMNLTRDEDNGFDDPWEWEDDEWLGRFKAFPAAEEIERETEARLNEAMEIMAKEGAAAALAHLFGDPKEKSE